MPEEVELVNLKDHPAAARDPKVRRWWNRTCWTIFFIGMTVVLAALIVQPPSPVSCLSWALKGAAICALVFLVPNTFMASEKFGGRKKVIHEWVRSRVPYLEVHKDDRPPVTVGDSTGKLSLYRHEHPEGYTYYTIVSRDEYVPQPFRGAGIGQYRLEEYLRLIGEEVKEARGEAARLAAAMGVLLVAALQVYLRLFRP